MISNRERIHRFSTSLGMALYDKKIELEGTKLLFFLDTDVVLNLVMGFESSFPDETFSEHSVVRSLFSIGYLGGFYLLRPHAFEFYEKIKNKRKFTSIESREQFRQRASEFIDRTNIAETMERLYSAIKEDNLLEPNNNVINKFLDVLREKPAEIFSHVEHINGTWSQRLRRLSDKALLKLDYLGPEIGELIINHRNILNKIYELVSKERSPQFSLNSFQDSAALTILYKYIEDWEKGKRNFVVRFYTETLSLSDALQNNHELREILRYPESLIQSYDYSDCCNDIFRPTDYFVMRALFDELAPNNPVSSEDLESLDNLYSKLVELLGDEDVNIEEAISIVTFDNRSLTDWIKSYETISIMETLWVSGGIDEILGELDELKRWFHIFEFAKGRRTKIILNAEIKDIRNKLETQVSRIGIWTQDFKILSKATKDRRRYLETIDDPMRDLGLVRWHYELKDNDRDKIANSIRELADESNISIVLGTIATDMEIARRDVKVCEIISPILWALGLFKVIDSVIASCRLNNPSQFPANLTAIQFAARMRSGLVSTETERRKTIIDVSNFFDRLSALERKGVLLSIGYIYYHAWRQAIIRSKTSERQWDKQSKELRDLAQRALEAGEQAFKEYKDNTLSWAYAVNHCAYVATATDIDSDKKRDYLTVLLKLETNAELWCSRFDDTVGFYYLDRAERRWYLSNEDNKRNLDISLDLEAAKAYFDAAKEKDAGDIDIDEHINRLHILMHDYEDYRQTGLTEDNPQAHS